MEENKKRNMQRGRKIAPSSVLSPIHSVYIDFISFLAFISLNEK
jgi:hypothetical protein